MRLAQDEAEVPHRAHSGEWELDLIVQTFTLPGVDAQDPTLFLPMSFSGISLASPWATKLNTTWPGVLLGAQAEVTGTQRAVGGGRAGLGLAWLPGGNAQGESCSAHWLRPAVAISFDTWLL